MWNNSNKSKTNGDEKGGVISKLQPFFLTNSCFVKKSQKIKPNEKDSLFWCYYILKNGMSSYEEQFQCSSVSVSSKTEITRFGISPKEDIPRFGISPKEDIPRFGISYIKEKKLKIQLVEELRNPIHRNKLKLCKLCSIDHIEDQLANEQTIDLATFFSLCFIFDIQVFYFKNKCYYKTLLGHLPWVTNSVKKIENVDKNVDKVDKDESIFDTIYNRYGTGYDEDDYDFETIFVLKKTNEKYWIDTENVLDLEWNNFYYIENVSKPLRGVSFYTALQIKEIAKKFDIDTKGKNKQEVYDMVKLIIKIDII